MLKLSHEELIADGWAKTSGAAAIGDVIKRLQVAGADSVVISRRDRSTIAGDGDRLIEVRAPAFEVVDGRGGGDSMTAALAVAAAQHRRFDDALRLAAAAATLNMSRHGLGTGRRDSIEEIAGHVDVVEISGRVAAHSARRSSSNNPTKAERTAERNDSTSRVDQR